MLRIITWIRCLRRLGGSLLILLGSITSKFRGWSWIRIKIAMNLGSHRQTTSCFSSLAVESSVSTHNKHQ